MPPEPPRPRLDGKPHEFTDLYRAAQQLQADPLPGARVTFTDVEPMPNDEDTQPGEVWLPVTGHAPLHTLDMEDED